MAHPADNQERKASRHGTGRARLQWQYRREGLALSRRVRSKWNAESTECRTQCKGKRDNARQNDRSGTQRR